MEGGLTITQALIAEYLQARQSEGLAEQTIANYRRKLRLVTVEAAQNGFFRCGDGLVRIPASFAGELLRFAKSQGIHAGPRTRGSEVK